MRLHMGDDSVELEIADDGVGFDPSLPEQLARQPGVGWGVVGMRESGAAAGRHVRHRHGAGQGHACGSPRHSPTNATTIPVKEGTTMSKSVRLLLVDDHPIVRTGLRMLFQSEPDMVVVGEVNGGEEALEAVQTLHPTWSSWTWQCRA